MARSPWPTVPDESPIDVSSLTQHARSLGISTRTELSALEAKNIERAIFKYLARTPSSNLAPFDYSWILKVHKEMFGDVWEWAGETRQRELNIGVPVHRIGGDLYDMLAALEEGNTYDMPILERAARLHHRAVAIHPFLNGNGRWARMLANIWLKRNRSPIIKWPEESIGQTSTIREKYIAAIMAADKRDCGPLISLHEQYAGGR